MALIRVGGSKEEHASFSLLTIASGNILTAYGFDNVELEAASQQGTGSFTSIRIGNFTVSATYDASTRFTVSVSSVDGKTYTLTKNDGTVIGTFNSTPVSFNNNNATIYCFAS